MSDKLNEFFKKHDVELEAPKGEFARIQTRVQKPSGFWRVPGLAYGSLGLAAAVFALVVFSPKPTVSPESLVVSALTDDEATEFIQVSFEEGIAPEESEF